MAVGLDFLSKTKMGGTKDVMSSSATSAKTGASGVNSVFAKQSSEKTSSAQKTDNKDMTQMNTSDLLKYVYDNQGGQENEVKLPRTVEYGDDNQEFTSHGKTFDEVVKDISKATGDSKTKVESELKRKYTSAGGSNSKGSSLNMQA